jgi:hypothetical protein
MQDTLVIPELSSSGSNESPRGEEYEGSFTSQSVQLKPRVGTDRQPASDTINTGLLELPVGRYYLSRHSPVE